MVGEEVEVEAVEGQDEEDREDYEPEEAERNLTKKSDIEWRHTPFTPVNTTWESPAPAPEPPEPLTPYDYFKKYVPSEMFQLMTTMTNIYAEQNAVKGYKHASVSEIEALVGLHMAMGVLGLPRVQIGAWICRESRLRTTSSSLTTSSPPTMSLKCWQKRKSMQLEQLWFVALQSPH